MSDLVQVAGAEEASGDVVFVHGLDGDARETWQVVGDPKTFWPSWLGEELPQMAVWTLAYEAHALNWSGTSMPLLDRASNVLDLLAVKIPAPRPLFFIAHSLGGLLVKQMIRRAADRSLPVARNTRGVVFLATPHSGSQKATWLERLPGLARQSVTTHELEAHSAELRDLDIWYREKAPGLGIQNRVYYETRAVKGLKIVDETSADPGIPNVAPIALDADHISISKPSTRNDQMFLGVIQFLRQCLGVPQLVAAPLKARFQVKALDGRTPVDVGEFHGALPEGAKFRLQLANTAATRVLVDRVRAQVKFHALPAAEAPKIDAAALRFGDARVPHQLHLELRGTACSGRWVIQMPNGTAELRPIAEGLENLLDTDPPTEFDLAPGETESITGSLMVKLPGIYEVSLEIGTAVLGESAAPSRTESLTLVQFNPPAGG